MGRESSDEAYVLDLCDAVLGERGLRQHRFDWLRGDPGKNGRSRTLPVDGYWPEHHLWWNTANGNTTSPSHTSTNLIG
jgi:hypothetical protein